MFSVPCFCEDWLKLALSRSESDTGASGALLVPAALFMLRTSATI